MSICGRADFAVSEWINSDFGEPVPPTPTVRAWEVPEDYRIDEATRFGCVVKEVSDDGWIQTIPAELESLIDGFNDPSQVQRAEINETLAPIHTRLSGAVSFDYMGSAEFEFGALPQSFRRIEELLMLCSENSYGTPLYAAPVPTLK